MNTTKQLVNLVIRGDMKAYEQLYEDSSKQVYYTCLSFLKNEQDALDIMQDTYISALTHLKELQDKNRFSQWVNKIAVNKCKDYLIKKKPIPIEEEIMSQFPAEEGELVLPEKYITEQASRKILLDIMSKNLSAIQYQTVILYYFDGLSQTEIAQCMDCPEGTVSYRLSVARSKIKESVKKYEKTSGDKLYSVSGIPFLAAFFIAETKTLAVPNVLAAITGSAISAGTASSLAGALSTKAITSGATASTATKAGLSAVLDTVKVKIAIGVASLAVIGGVTAGAIMMSKDEPKVPESVVVYESEYLSVEYVDVHYEDSRADKDYNGELMVTVTIENKTDEELIIDNFNYCVNHMSNIGSKRGSLLPGENEIIFIIDLLGLKDEGSVDIDSAQIVFSLHEMGSNDTTSIEKPYFSLEFDETITINANPYYPFYKDTVKIYEDDYIEFWNTPYMSKGVESDLVSDFSYIYNNSDKLIAAHYWDNLNRYGISIIFPDSYCYREYHLTNNVDETTDSLSVNAYIEVNDYLGSDDIIGSGIYDTEAFSFDITKQIE